MPLSSLRIRSSVNRRTSRWKMYRPSRTVLSHFRHVRVATYGACCVCCGPLDSRVPAHAQVLIDDRRIHVDFSQSVGKLWNSWYRENVFYPGLLNPLSPFCVAPPNAPPSFAATSCVARTARQQPPASALDHATYPHLGDVETGTSPTTPRVTRRTAGVTVLSAARVFPSIYTTCAQHTHTSSSLAPGRRWWASGGEKYGAKDSALRFRSLTRSSIDPLCSVNNNSMFCRKLPRGARGRRERWLQIRGGGGRGTQLGEARGRRCQAGGQARGRGGARGEAGTRGQEVVGPLP